MFIEDEECEEPFKDVFGNEYEPEGYIDAVIERLVFVEEDTGEKSVHFC